MTNDFFAPVDAVSATDRAAAEQRLRDAHARGLLSAGELDARVSAVIMAERLDDLRAAETGPIPMWTNPRPGGYREPELVGYHHSMPRSDLDRAATPVMAVAAHLSPFLTWLIGPAVIWALSPAGSYSRREAAKAFNWQLIAFVIGISVALLGNLLPGDGNPLAPIWMVLWLILTVVGAARAANRQDWINPIRRLVPWEVLPERRG